MVRLNVCFDIDQRGEINFLVNGEQSQRDKNIEQYFRYIRKHKGKFA